MSAPFPRHCPRQPDRATNQAQTSSSLAPSLLSIKLHPYSSNQAPSLLSEASPVILVVTEPALVSSRNGAILSVVAGEHCKGWALAGQGCAQ